MENALIVSSTEKGTTLFSELLNAASINQITALKSAAQTRMLLLERDFDLVVINAPLQDESGESLCRDIASRGVSQIMLAVQNEFFEAVSAVCEEDGILTISKPVNRELFWSALTLAKSTQNRIKRIQVENTKFKQKIDDIRIVDRAKWMLINHVNMSEQEAHRFIEKQAMDLRVTKRVIAEGILKKYYD